MELLKYSELGVYDPSSSYPYRRKRYSNHAPSREQRLCSPREGAKGGVATLTACRKTLNLRLYVNIRKGVGVQRPGLKSGTVVIPAPTMLRQEDRCEVHSEALPQKKRKLEKVSFDALQMSSHTVLIGML